MPWCPKCKTEYVDGITICSDCGTELVEEMNDGSISIPDIHFDKEEDVTEFVEFLNYSNIENVQSSFDLKSETYIISVSENNVKETIKLYGIFQTEKTNAKENDSDKETDIDNNSYENPIMSCPSCSSPYVKKEEKYQDLKSTASTFTIFGILGLIYVYLNVVGILSFLNGVVQTLVITAMFIGFIYVGITSYLNSKTAKKEISSENELTEKMNHWLTENITPDKLNEMNDVTVSSEINFLHKLDQIKVMLVSEFGDLDDSYLDRIVEDFYNDHFDNN